MSRRRLIKPELWGNEQLAECSFGARLLFIGLLNFADDNGLLQNRAKKIKMNIFPADNVDVEKFIHELVSVGLVEKYQVENVEYLWVINFSVHQKITNPTYSEKVPPQDILELHGYTTKSIGSADFLTIIKKAHNFPQVKLREEKLREVKLKEKSSAFAPPSVQEVKEYCLERNNNVDAEQFVNFYDSKGWFVGKNKMKNWKSAVLTWEKRDNFGSKKCFDLKKDPDFFK